MLLHLTLILSCHLSVIKPQARQLRSYQWVQLLFYNVTHQHNSMYENCRLTPHADLSLGPVGLATLILTSCSVGLPHIVLP